MNGLSPLQNSTLTFSPTLNNKTPKYSIVGRSNQNETTNKVTNIAQPYWEFTPSGAQYHSSIRGAVASGKATAIKNGTFGTKESKWYGAYLYPYPKKNYDKMHRLFLLSANKNQVGVAGVALKKHLTNSGWGNSHEIVSVFKNSEYKKKGVATQFLLPKAIAHGGNHLDCYSPTLAELYGCSGFRPVAKLPFNRYWAPKDWNYARDGEPDHIFMVLDQNALPPLKDGDNKKERKRKIQEMIQNLPYSKNYFFARNTQKKEATKIQHYSTTKLEKILSYASLMILSFLSTCLDFFIKSFRFCYVKLSILKCV